MKNNKITRKRAAKLAAKQQAQVAGHLSDGTEVLRNKESRAKNRRWSFEADITIVLNAPTNEDGTPKLDEQGAPVPTPEMPQRTVKLDAVSYSTAKEAKGDCKTHEAYLRATNLVFSRSKINVRAIPHETVSNTTLNQLSGYRDMAMILDKALALSIEEAEQVVLGKSVGSQFVQREEVPRTAGSEDPEVPARTTATIKEEFYKRALETFKARREETDPAIIRPDPAIIVTDANDEERQPFVPEIVNPDSVLV